MRIIIEEIEGAHYQDVILSPMEVKALSDGARLEGLAIIRNKRFYVGLHIGHAHRQSIEPYDVINIQETAG